MSYCNIDSYLNNSSKNNEELSKIAGSLCVNLNSCRTLIIPNSDVINNLKLLVKAKGQDASSKRREALLIIRSHMVLANLSDEEGKVGRECKNTLNHKLKVSQPTNGVYEILSGKGLKESATIKPDKDFIPDLTLKGDRNIPISVFVIQSGKISTEGDMFIGSSEKKMSGGSEFSSNKMITKRIVFERLCNTFIVYLTNDNKASDIFTQTAAGLLKYLLINKDNISEYEEISKLVSSFSCYEGFALIYLLITPYSDTEFLNNRLFSEWAYTPYLGNYCETIEAFCDSVPLGVDNSMKESLLKNIQENVGIVKLDSIKSSYDENCKSLFDSINNFPCNKKLWIDECCYFIMSEMENIRKTKNVQKFKDLQKSLMDMYPGINMEKESLIGNSDILNKEAKNSFVSKIDKFLTSGCFMRSDCNSGSLDNEYKSLIGDMSYNLSNYSKNFIEMNKPLV